VGLQIIVPSFTHASMQKVKQALNKTSVSLQETLRISNRGSGNQGGTAPEPDAAMGDPEQFSRSSSGSDFPLSDSAMSSRSDHKRRGKQLAAFRRKALKVRKKGAAGVIPSVKSTPNMYPHGNMYPQGSPTHAKRLASGWYIGTVPQGCDSERVVTSAQGALPDVFLDARTREAGAAAGPAAAGGTGRAGPQVLGPQGSPELQSAVLAAAGCDPRGAALEARGKPRGEAWSGAGACDVQDPSAASPRHAEGFVPRSDSGSAAMSCTSSRGGSVTAPSFREAWASSSSGEASSDVGTGARRSHAGPWEGCDMSVGPAAATGIASLVKHMRDGTGSSRAPPPTHVPSEPPGFGSSEGTERFRTENLHPGPANPADQELKSSSAGNEGAGQGADVGRGRPARAAQALSPGLRSAGARSFFRTADVDSADGGPVAGHVRNPSLHSEYHDALSEFVEYSDISWTSLGGSGPLGDWSRPSSASSAAGVRNCTPRGGGAAGTLGSGGGMAREGLGSCASSMSAKAHLRRPSIVELCQAVASGFTNLPSALAGGAVDQGAESVDGEGGRGGIV
jgi:hypothetical protein